MDTKQLRCAELLESVHAAFAADLPADRQLRNVLELVLQEYGGVVGSIHRLDQLANLLRLEAEIGIPPMLLQKVSAIPIGKGMAGLAAERRAPVQVCNLQTDASGVAKPSARETGVEGSITVPIMLDGELLGTLGIAKPAEHEFTEEETRCLMSVGEEIGKRFRMRERFRPYCNRVQHE
ncbi:MAG: GAF domain-containing protein [Chlorobi bacterium CHB2]|nr:GAF domain-containing protein [Chlorobi bacterium CHB2]